MTLNPELTRTIYERLQSGLPPHRLHHVLGVAHRAAEFAKLIGADPERTILAAYLHDIGKGMEPEEMRAQLQRIGSDIPEEDRPFPPIWHAYFARETARVEFGIDDEVVLDAVHIHPTGAPEMTLEAAALFLADFTEPTRDFTPRADVAALAAENLNAALLEVLDEKIQHVERKGKPVHPRALKARAHYRTLAKEVSA